MAEVCIAYIYAPSCPSASFPFPLLSLHFLSLSLCFSFYFAFTFPFVYFPFFLFFALLCALFLLSLSLSFSLPRDRIRAQGHERTRYSPCQEQPRNGPKQPATAPKTDSPIPTPGRHQMRRRYLFLSVAVPIPSFPSSPVVKWSVIRNYVSRLP